MPQASAVRSPPEPSPARIHVVGSLLAGSSAALATAYLLTVALRLDLSSAPRAALLGLVCWTVLVVGLPWHASCTLVLALPLFGNHPGGPLMEVLNLLLAATTLGLTLRAWRRRRPPPGGTVWLSALLVVLSAGLALVRTLPEAAVRVAQIGFVPSLVAQTLTAAETVPLYSISSFINLVMAAAWAYALCWAGADLAFAKNALRYLALGLFAVMVVGALGFHGLIDIRARLLSPIDTKGAFLEGFQSLFWNPGWFAWYFTMTFGLALGLLWLERGRVRAGVALGLVISYVYFLANRQRGGFLALHAVLLVAVAAGASRRRWSRRAAMLAAAGVLVPVLGMWWGAVAGSRWFLSLERLLESASDIHRRALWTVALQMWRSSPLCGIGEGAFGWQYRGFLSEALARDIGVFTGDAHNTWLQLLATRGVFGLVAFLALLVVLGRRALAAARSSGPERGVGLGLGFGLVALVIYANAQWVFYLQSIQVLFWAIVAMATMVAPSGNDHRPMSWSRRTLGGAVLVTVVAVQAASSRPLYLQAATDIARQPRGFYGPAQWARSGEVFRWSSKRGTLWLYPTGPVMTYQVLTTDPLATTRPVAVTLGVEGRLLDRFDLGRGSIRRSVFLPESYRYRPPPSPPVFGERLPGRSALPLTVEVSRLWTPYLTGSLDGRFLGVAVFAPSFRAPEPDDELGLIPSLDMSEAGARWTGARYSVSVDVAPHSGRLVVPLRPARWDGRPVAVEAFWDDRLVSSLVLGEDRWHDLRLELRGLAARGVLTLQADRVWRPPMAAVASEGRHAALQIGAWR